VGKVERHAAADIPNKNGTIGVGSGRSDRRARDESWHDRSFHEIAGNVT
jgi:hypothetical protein